MSKAYLNDGFELDIDEEVIDDIELFELFVVLQSGNRVEQVDAFPRFMTKILGSDQKKNLYDHLRNEKGRVRISDVEAVIPKIIEALKSKKN